jgi:hypothetical protein
MSMRNLRRKLGDGAYEQRFTARYAEHLLMLLPLLLFAIFSYRETGVLSLTAVAAAASSYLLVSGFFYYRARRDTLDALRREGLVDSDYRPPY